MREKRLSKGVLRHNRVTFKKLKKRLYCIKIKLWTWSPSEGYTHTGWINYTK